MNDPSLVKVDRSKFQPLLYILLTLIGISILFIKLQYIKKTEGRLTVCSERIYQEMDVKFPIARKTRKLKVPIKESLCRNSSCH